MALIIKVIGWFIGPIKYLLSKRVANYLFEKKIKSILREADECFEISTLIKPSELMQHATFRGLITEYLRPNQYVPCIADIAVATNISVSDYCNSDKKYSDSIIDLAFHISTELKKAFTFSQTLKLVMNNLQKDISKLEFQVDRKDIERIFSSKKSLFIHYFNSFSDQRFSNNITIWHQGKDNEWIEWNKKDSITVNVNPARIREGFFLTGFDYSNNQTDKALIVASRKKGYEYFNQYKSNNVIWIR